MLLFRKINIHFFLKLFHLKLFHRGHLASSLMLMLIGLLFIGLMNVIIKYLVGHYSSSLVGVMRNGSGLIFSIIILFAGGYFRKKRHKFKLSKPKLGLIRGIIVGVTQLCFFTSLQYIELATARALSYSSAIFVTLFAMILLKEKCGIWRISAVIVGFLGAFMVLGEGVSISGGQFFVYLLPILGASFYALTLISLQLFTPEDDHWMIMVYAQIGALIFTAMIVSFFSHWQLTLPWHHWLLVLSLGISGSLGVICISFAYRFSEASMMAPFHYVGLIYSLFLGWIFFAENPLAQLFPGALFIVGSGIVIAWREAYRAREGRKQRAELRNLVARSGDESQ